MAASYEELRAIVASKGLLERRYSYYALYGSLVIVATALGLYFITLTDNLALTMLNGVFLGMVLVQAGMLGHDFSHQQVFSSYRWNRFFGSIMWSLFGGVSEDKWYEKHNEHHTHVNHIDHDPDLDIPFIFSPKQIEKRSSLLNSLLLPHQHVIFFLALPFVYFSMVSYAWRHLLTRLTWKSMIETVFVFIHFALLFGITFLYLPLTTAIPFLAAVILVGGLYMSLVFAPNHKGEEVVEGDTAASWTQQITLTRNIYPSTFVFHMTGGLNFQIEHHLFSDMPRINYPKAHVLVKAYCLQHGIPYHETSWWGSMREIYDALKQTSEAYRMQKAAL